MKWHITPTTPDSKDCPLTTPVARANLHNIHEFVAERKSFAGSNITGRDGYAALYVGQLPSEYHAAFDRARYAPDFYVVRSYATPIAWYADGEWFVPNVFYNTTTSHHQSALGLVGDGTIWSTKAVWARNDA
jgi:hypothetical protein